MFTISKQPEVVTRSTIDTFIMRATIDPIINFSVIHLTNVLARYIILWYSYSVYQKLSTLGSYKRSSPRQPCQNVAPINQTSFILCRHLANRLCHLAIRLLTRRRQFDILFYSIPSSKTLSLGSGKPNCVFSANRVWFVTRFHLLIRSQYQPSTLYHYVHSCGPVVYAQDSSAIDPHQVLFCFSFYYSGGVRS